MVACGQVHVLHTAFRSETNNAVRVAFLEGRMVGFVAAERRDTMNLVSSDNVLTVFIPTTPNPTSGFLVIVSPAEVIDLDYSVEEAFKFVVSMGIIGKDLAPTLEPAGSLQPESG